MRHCCNSFAAQLQLVSRLGSAAILWLVLVACSATGCHTGALTRSAQVLEPGQFSFRVHTTPAAHSSGRAEMRKLTGDTLTVEGNAAPMLRVPYLAYAAFWYWFEYSLRLGLGGPCELGIEYGLVAQSAELRCAVLSEASGAPFSLAVGSAASYFPMHQSNDWLYRASVEASYDFDTAYSLAAGAFFSHGPFAHAIGAELPDKFVGADSDLFFTVDPYIYIERMQTRLSFSLGMLVWLDDAHGMRLHFGAQPFFVLDDGELLASECLNCYFLELDSFRERFGIAASVGFEVLDGRPRSPTEAAPPGYRWERGWNEELLILGAVTAGVAYSLFVPAVIFAVEAERNELAVLWFVPVVGPLLWQSGLSGERAGIADSALADMLGVGSAVLQGFAIVAFIEAAFSGPGYLVPDEASLTLLPSASSEQLGVVATGRF